MKKKALALVLSFAMVVGIFPSANAHASEMESVLEITETEETETIETETTETETTAETETVETETAETETEETETVETETEETKETVGLEDDTTYKKSKAKLAEEKEIVGSSYAVGRNGIVYEGVKYLTASKVYSMSNELQNAYYDICDEIANIKLNNMVQDDIVITYDGKTGLEFEVKVPFEALAESQIELSEFAMDDIPLDDYSESVEEVYAGEAEVAEISEFSEEPEMISDEANINEFNTTITNKSYFSNQLKGVAPSIYKTMLPGLMSGQTSYSVSLRSVAGCNDGFSDALSAFILTYPAKADWMGKGEEGYYSYRGKYSNGGYNFSVTVNKSSFYSNSLELQAQNKVATIYKEAAAYAKKNTSAYPIYGMIAYFDAWICNNNYYNDNGTNEYRYGKTAEYYYCHSSYGVLLKKYGVCESYALGMSRLLDAAGIPNVYVVGTAGGGHAWNYVMMPNGKWYLLDSTWNDTSGTKNYRLVKNDGIHKAEGKGYSNGNKFNFPALDTVNYKVVKEPITFSNETYYVGKGSVCQKLKKTGYYKTVKKSFASSNKKIATVDQAGNIKGVAPGTTTITMKMGGAVKTVNVVVYQLSGLKFTNNKSALSDMHLDTDDKFDSKDTKKYVLQIGTNSNLTAQQIAEFYNKPVLTTSGNQKIATATSTLSGNQITLTVQPKAIGTTKITVKYFGKKAILTLNVKKKMQASWFNDLPFKSKEFTGQPICPKVTKSSSAPSNLKFKVIYAKNKNAGTATVTIRGTGNYGGDIVKTFTITPKNISNAKVQVKARNAKYNGGTRNASVVVKLGDKVLTPNKDYKIQYNTTPINIGEYTMKVVGIGNYEGTVAQDLGKFTIKPATIAQVKIVCPKVVKYTGNNIKPVKAVKIGNQQLPTSVYTVKYYKKSDTKLATAVTPKDKGKYFAVVTSKSGNIVNAGKQDKVKVVFEIK